MPKNHVERVKERLDRLAAVVQRNGEAVQQAAQAHLDAIVALPREEETE